MIKSKLVKILSTFSRKELNTIYFKFNSISTKKEKAEMVLLEYILQGIEVPETLSKKEAYIKCFGNGGYNDAKFRLMMYELLQKVETEITYQSIVNDQHIHQIALLNYYEKNNLNKLFDQDLKKFTQSNEKISKRNVDFYEHQFILEQMRFDHDSKIKRSRGKNMQELLDQIDIVFISKKLRQSCHAIGQGKVFQSEFDFGFFDDILNFVQKNNFDDTPAVNMYFLCYKMLTDGTEQSFEAFKKYLIEYSDYFPHKELRNIYLLAINYCIQSSNSGRSEYGRQGLELYKYSLSKGILLVDNHLSLFTYSNIAAMAMIVKEFEWAEQFMNEYKKLLRRDERENAYFYNLAFLYYNQEKYSEAMDALLQTRMKDFLQNLRGKTLQLKIYYSLEEDTVLDSHLDAMKIYLIRNKVIGYQKQLFLNVISLTKKLMRLRNAINLSKSARALRIEKLRQTIIEKEKLSERPWFLAQLDKMS